jgi:peptide/nickel transport system ATP-binding protein
MIAARPHSNETGGRRETRLELTGLRVALTTGEPIVEGVDLELTPGEILGLVGESGSGKTTAALALLGYSARGAVIERGTLSIDGRLIEMDESMRRVRGDLISYIPQDPGRALNPSRRIADSIDDMIIAHRHAAAGSRGSDVAIASVGLPDGREFARRFPHQLSGGQQQRVCIAISVACEPKVVVLDEPTTGLDVVTQSRILQKLRSLRDEHQMSMIYVTHDLAVVAQIADRVAVMYAGRIVEQGPVGDILRHPRHPYTRGLLTSIPDHHRPRPLEPMPGIALGVGEWPNGCAFAPRCAQKSQDCDVRVPRLLSVDDDAQTVRCIHARDTPPLSVPVSELRAVRASTAPGPQPGPVLTVSQLRAEHRSAGESRVVAADISFTVALGECVALVGESGSGKTTIARAIVGLHRPSAGTIDLNGERLPAEVTRRSREQRRRVQIVFQHPADALNPRHAVRAALARPLTTLRGLGRADRDREITRLMDAVRLPQRLVDRYPSELSGGERQRVAIARALAAEPALILCDEVTSALDVSVQAAVLQLLNDLRREYFLSLLLITHDLGVVATVADRVLVLQHGLICERGRTTDVLNAPSDLYTQQLLAAAPSVSAALSGRAAA